MYMRREKSYRLKLENAYLEVINQSRKQDMNIQNMKDKLRQYEYFNTSLKIFKSNKAIRIVKIKMTIYILLWKVVMILQPVNHWIFICQEVIIKECAVAPDYCQK